MRSRPEEKRGAVEEAAEQKKEETAAEKKQKQRERRGGAESPQVKLNRRSRARRSQRGDATCDSGDL
ncbi:hypothetical protein AHAS_Ahas13G0070300 [Arachis hypogaea]